MEKQIESLLERTQHELARRKHLRFMQHCWQKGLDNPLIVGLHTKMICDRIDKAFDDYREGKSTYLRIAIHPRAGKSDIVSRFLPPHFLAEFPDNEVITASYSKDKAVEFGRAGRQIVQTEKFEQLYPSIRVSASSGASGNWRVAKYDEETELFHETLGRSYSSGLGSGLSGNGGHLMVLDDYTATRKAVESSTQREGMWVSFTEEFMTRRAPHTIVIILATQWHEDDIHGRIKKKNDPTDEMNYDPEFPVFEYMSFPARAEDSEFGDQYPGDYLFLERYPAQWYKEQYATMGLYAASALMDCDPTPRTGGIIDTSGIQFHNSITEFPKNLKWMRVWDYAHTAKQRTGDDPDYTGGTLMALEKLGYNQYVKQMEYAIWIQDYSQFRLQATERDAKIREITRRDGMHVRVVVEKSLDSIDGADYLQQQLRGIRVVTTVKCTGDKVTRCAPLEPIFVAERVHALKGTWNKVWITGLQRFDGSGKSHDEMVDNLTAGYEYTKKGTGYTPLKVKVV